MQKDDRPARTNGTRKGKRWEILDDKDRHKEEEKEETENEEMGRELRECVDR